MSPDPICPGCGRPLSSFILPHDEVACLATHRQRSRLLVFGEASTRRWGTNPPVDSTTRLEHADGAGSEESRRLESTGVER